jgi:putative transposase
VTNVRRHEIPGQLEHVIARGVHGDQLSPKGPWATELFNAIAREADERDWKVWAFCVMGTHYHLLVETPDASLALGLQRAHSAHASRRNHREPHRRGAVFGRRYLSIPIRDAEHLRNSLAYIPLNPVQAGLCADAADWSWSTYRATIGLESCPRWVAKTDVLRFLKGPFGEAADEATYRRLVGSGVGAPTPPLGVHDCNRYDIECLIDRGYSNPEIARRLGMSDRQVRRLGAARRRTCQVRTSDARPSGVHH